MRAIFISYRRDDSEGQAGRLYDDLSRRFGDASVFMDVTAIEPGLDFRKVIDHNVASCGVLLAVIGPGWLEAKDESGQRRLDNPTDFVRLETASALKRDIPVVPVLVHGARMPRSDQLPEDLGELAYRNGLELTHARWDSDVEVLVKALQRHVKEEGVVAEQKSGASSAAPRSEAHAKLPPLAPVKNRGSLVAIGLVAAAGVAFGLYMSMHRSPTPDAGRTPAAVTAPPQSVPAQAQPPQAQSSQAQPLQVATAMPTKPQEQEVQPLTSQSEPARTAVPRSIVRKSSEPAPAASPISKASAQAREPAAPTPAAAAPAVAAPAGSGPDARSTQTTSADSSKMGANTAAPVAPVTPNPSNAYAAPTAAQNSPAINPNLQRFAVGHYGVSAQDYCLGVMTLDAGFLRYQAISGTHTYHTFNFAFNRIKEIKRNAMVFSMNQAFHVRLDDGEIFNFSEVDPNTLRYLNPDGLINAVRTAAGK